MSDFVRKNQIVRTTAAFGFASAVLAAAGLLLNGSLGLETRVMAASTPSYSTDIVPILSKNCLACHSSAAHMSGLVLDSYETLMKGGKHGPPVVPKDAKASRMVQMLEGEAKPQMPFGADPLPASDIALIKSWIDAGAPGPAAGEAVKATELPPVPDIRPEVAVVSPISSVKFSPDGKVLAVGGYRELRLIDAATDKLLATLSGQPDSVRSIAFSPDGKMVAAAGGAPQIGGEIDIWDLASHQLLKTMKGHKDCIYSIAWSPDGTLIASGSYDKAVKLWDVASGKELRTLQDHIDAVFAVAFRPDGKRLASASQDRTVKIWDVATGTRLYTLSDASDGLNAVAWAPSGEQVAAAGYDKTIYIWKLAENEGHLSQSLIADEESILGLVWSPDGKTIVTASSDGSIRFRDLRLNPIGVIDRQPDWVESMDISPDGKWLAAGRYNGSLSVYDARTYKQAREPMTVFDKRQPAPGNDAKEAASR